MARLVIFIDGGYVSKLAKIEFEGIYVDYEKFPNEILNTIAQRTPEPLDLLRTYYYDCLPYQSDPPTQEERKRFASKRRFFAAIEHIPRFTVRQGRLEFRGKDIAGEPIFQQKRVDLMLGLDFALLSGKQQITHAAIVAGDSDLIPAFRVAANEGIAVWLFHGPRKSVVDGRPTFALELWQAADERCEIEKTFIEKVKR